MPDGTECTSHQSCLKRTETATNASMVVATRGERGSLLMVRHVRRECCSAVCDC